MSLKKLLQQGISNPEFYGDLVYKFKKFIGNTNFSDLFKRIVNRLKSRAYFRRYTADCIFSFFNLIICLKAMLHFCCLAVVHASDLMTASM